MPKTMNGGISAKLNILALAAYERARRAMRGECELDFAQGAKGELSASPQAKKLRAFLAAHTIKQFNIKSKRTRKRQVLISVGNSLYLCYNFSRLTFKHIDFPVFM